jgi:hypothetical protein
MNRTRLYLLVLGLSLAGYGWIAWDAGTRSSFTPCPFKLATGLPCPSCGTTRALAEIASGDIAGSTRTNPFGLLMAFALVAFPPWIVYDLVRSRDGFLRFYRRVEEALRRHRGLAFVCIALVVANWGWNVLKGF